ncbi:MAG: hypothetical protein JWO06_2273 [Bacteroidota bacterium]|nr:hypothetical protein [Bacteroidota bacterium]
MKLIIAIAITFILSSVKAADTLTVAQVYNFNVGDTFDYKSITQDLDIGIDSTQYKRKVLMQRTYNTTLDTLFLGFGPPGGSVSETRSISNLDSFVLSAFGNSACNQSYSFDSSTYGNPMNWYEVSCFESFETYSFTKGLGQTFYAAGYFASNSYYSEQLIYYSNGTTKLGTPYYVLGIEDPIAPTFLWIYPTLVTDNLFVKTVDSRMFRFKVFDLNGRQIISGNINSSLSTISVSSLQSGMYFIEFFANGQTSTHRFIVQR